MSGREKEVRAFIEKELNISLKDYNSEVDLFSALGLDSLEALSMLAKLEKKFNFKIPNEELSDTRSISSVMRFVK